MRKLTLDLDAIQVDSFTTDAAPADRGTVVGAQQKKTLGPDCVVIDHGWYTLQPTCTTHGDSHALECTSVASCLGCPYTAVKTCQCTFPALCGPNPHTDPH